MRMPVGKTVLIRNVCMFSAGVLALAMAAAGCARASGSTVCGNGAVEGGEECDDGNDINGDGCSADCREEPVCGNTICESNEDEQNCPDDCLNCPNPNTCGGCGSLPNEPGDSCGTCGIYVCDGTDAVTCDDPGLNACNGCAVLTATPDDPCGDCGVYACDGTEAVICDDPGLNGCGGCTVLSPDLNDPCGDCGVYACDGLDAVQCFDPGFNACGGCDPLANQPGDPCATCGTYECSGQNAVVCNEPSVCCAYDEQILPSSWDGAGCTVSDTYFNYTPCGTWKVYDVTPNEWLHIRTWGDGCAACVLWHIGFDIQENLGSGFTTVEHHDPEPDAKDMVYYTDYRPTTSQIRIYSANGFYARVYRTGITNGGFETGSVAPMSGINGAQTPAVTTNSTYVAGRAAYAFGVAYTGATFGTDDGLYWGITVPVDCPYIIAAGSHLYFDTYADDYQQYAHHHVTLTFTDTTTAFYDSYMDFNQGFSSGWSLQAVDIETGNIGKTIDSIEITIHKDHTTFSRYRPTIFIDNITLH